MKICEPAIYELIKDVVGVNIDVFLLKAKQSPTDTFVVFQKTDKERWRDINGPSGFGRDYIQIDVYSPSSYTAIQTAADIENALDGYAGTVYHGADSPQTEFVEIGNIVLQNGADIIDETDDPVLYRAFATYLVTYTQ